MGAFNTFRSLKEYAEKLVSFKQGVMIEEAAVLGVIKEAHYTNVLGGICASLVMQWFNQQESGVGMFGRRNDKDVGVSIVEFSLPSYLAYTKNPDVDKKRTALAKAWGLKLDPGDRFTSESLVDAQEMNSSFGQTAKLYIAAVTSKGGNHALGMYRDKEDRDHFFDPNVGEYKIHAHQVSDFYREYERIVQESLEWTYKNFICFPMFKEGRW